MSRLIDADVLIETFKNTEDSDHCKWSTAGIVDEIKFAPTVEVYTREEVKTLLNNIRSRMKKYCDNKIHADEWVDGFNFGVNRMVDLMEEEINDLDQFINKPCISEGVCSADAVKALKALQLEIEEMSGLCTEIHGDEWNEINTVHSQDVLSLIQQKINALQKKHEIIQLFSVKN